MGWTPEEIRAFDSMHCWERLIEHALAMTAMNYPVCRDWLIKYFKGLTKKQLREAFKEAGVELSKDEWKEMQKFELTIRDLDHLKIDAEEMEEYDICRFNMIFWKYCRVIALTQKIWLPLYEKEINQEIPKRWIHDPVISAPAFNEDFVKMWQSIEDVWRITHAHSDQVKIFKQNNYEDQSTKLEQFGKLWIEVFSSHLPWYLHILVCHTISVWEETGGSLNLLTNQGAESAQSLQKKINQAIGKNGGLATEKRSSFPSQDVLLYCLRMLAYKDKGLMNEVDEYFEVVLKEWNELTGELNRKRRASQKGIPPLSIESEDTSPQTVKETNSQLQLPSRSQTHPSITSPSTGTSTHCCSN